MQRKESKPRGSDHRPTRQHIAYLGGILQDDVKHVERRAAFWAKATAKLDALSKRVSPEERRKLEATPPSATSNSRRPRVTVIRPSRARCVKGTIPRHEGAVFTLKEGWTAALAAQPKDECLSPVSPLASSARGMTE